MTLWKLTMVKELLDVSCVDLTVAYSFPVNNTSFNECLSSG